MVRPGGRPVKSPCPPAANSCARPGPPFAGAAREPGIFPAARMPGHLLRRKAPMSPLRLIAAALAAPGAEPMLNSPAQFADWKSESARWAQVVRQVNLKIQ